MKKKTFAIALLITGFALFCVPVIMTVICCSKANIIGGADWSTLEYVLFYQNNGLHFILLCVGIISIITSLILIKTNKN